MGKMMSVFLDWGVHAKQFGCFESFLVLDFILPHRLAPFGALRAKRL